jgi:hypothetical protein
MRINGENAESRKVTDKIGNTNNLLVVAPEHLGHVGKAATGDERAITGCQAGEMPERSPTDALPASRGNGEPEQNTAHHKHVPEATEVASEVPESKISTPTISPSGMASENQGVEAIPSTPKIPTAQTNVPMAKSPEDATKPDHSSGSAIGDMPTGHVGIVDRKLSKEDVEQVKLLMIGSRDRLPSFMDMSSRVEREYSSNSLGAQSCEYNGVPLLSHERLSFEDLEPLGTSPDSPDGLFMPPKAPERQNSSDFRESGHGFARSPTEEDLTDPLLEVFPSGRKAILKRLDTLRMEIAPDESMHLNGDGTDDRLSSNVPALPHELSPMSPSATRDRSRSSNGSFASPRLNAKGRHSPLNRPEKKPGMGRERATEDRRAIEEESADLEAHHERSDKSVADVTPFPLLELPDPEPLAAQDESSSISLENETQPLLGSSAAEPVDSTAQGTRYRGKHPAVGQTDTTKPPAQRQGEGPKMAIWYTVLGWFGRIWASLLSALGAKQAQGDKS